MRRVRAYVGLGANLGDAETTLANGIRALAMLPEARLRAVSRLYATAPVGVADQPWFRNAVAGLDAPAGRDPTAGALALLVALKQLERAFGRQDRERWGPRELDLDLLVFGRARLAVDRPPEGVSLDPGKADRLLVVPHGAAGERLFVLAPLADIAPGLVPPGWRETVATALARRLQVEGADAVRPVARWDAERSGWEPLAAAPPRGGRPPRGPGDRQAGGWPPADALERSARPTPGRRGARSTADPRGITAGSRGRRRRTAE